VGEPAFLQRQQHAFLSQDSTHVQSFAENPKNTNIQSMPVRLSRQQPSVLNWGGTISSEEQPRNPKQRKNPFGINRQNQQTEVVVDFRVQSIPVKKV